MTVTIRDPDGDVKKLLDELKAAETMRAGGVPPLTRDIVADALREQLEKVRGLNASEAWAHRELPAAEEIAPHENGCDTCIECAVEGEGAELKRRGDSVKCALVGWVKIRKGCPGYEEAD